MLNPEPIHDPTLDWSTPPKPAELAENRMINAILSGAFRIGAALPAERELAGRLGVTRPTLREALQRLARDGWIEIHQGKPTRVRDYWHEGRLGVLNALAERPWAAPDDFILNLLAVRLALAPAYTRLAVEQQPGQVVSFLSLAGELWAGADAGEAENARRFAEFDWQLHHRLTVLSGNPIFTLILNGFSNLYEPLACRYFESRTARSGSIAFYTGIAAAAQSGDADTAEAITRRVMNASIALWKAVDRRSDKPVNPPTVTK